MSKRTRLVVAAMLCLIGLFGEQGVVFMKRLGSQIVGPKTPEVVIPDPSPEYQELVKPLVDLDFSDEHRDLLSGYFTELASVLENDPGFVKTTGQFRDYNIIAGQLNFAGVSIRGVYPDLGKTIDDALLKAIGKENSTLSPEKRERLVNTLKAVAWGVNK